jgi:hypothetical protein
LLAAGARRDIVNDQGENAVHWAMRHNNLSIARASAAPNVLASSRHGLRQAGGRRCARQPVPDRADSLMAAARRMEASGAGATRH